MYRVSMFRSFTSLALIALLGAACTPRSTHKAVVAQLDICQADLTTARDDAFAWRERLDRWEHQIGLRLGEQETATAMSLDTIQLKFNEIRSAVPQVIEAEVGGHIDEVEKLLIAGFRDLSRGNQALQQQLENTRLLLNEARDELHTGNQLARTAQSERREIRGQISGITAEHAALVSRIHEFDRTRLQCKSCPEYLDLRKRKASDVTAFHNQLVEQLYGLQGDLVAPVSVDDGPARTELATGDD